MLIKSSCVISDRRSSISCLLDMNSGSKARKAMGMDVEFKRRVLRIAVNVDREAVWGEYIPMVV